MTGNFLLLIEIVFLLLITLFIVFVRKLIKENIEKEVEQFLDQAKIPKDLKKLIRINVKWK